MVAVIGCGNVGANLLQHIVDMDSIDKIFAIGREGADSKAKAAILDTASYKPREASKIIAAPNSCLHEADIIVIAAGYKPRNDKSYQAMMMKNLEIINLNLKNVELKDSAIIIVVTGPVDIATHYAQKKSGLPHSQVIGFGGNLDLNRLIYSLKELNISSEGASVVGEHGSRVIPVYASESQYDAVASRVRNFLSDIGKLAGQKRNLATAPLVASLINSIVEDKKDVHFISGYNVEYGLYLTWPFRIGRKGIITAESLTLPPRAKNEFELLLEKKNREMQELGTMIHG